MKLDYSICSKYVLTKLVNSYHKNDLQAKFQKKISKQISKNEKT